MALRGTLRDFGIADILQLIGQQAKTGILRLESKNKDEEVHVSFYQGNVVRAEEVGRHKRDFLGRMLVRAELVTEAQVGEALEEQKRTLRRLGDIMIEKGMISQELLAEMAQLQATETLYRLFEWRSGTYRFEQTNVSWDRESFVPIRSEAVLMEGFRLVDEWPLVRRKIRSRFATFAPGQPFPGAGADLGAPPLDDRDIGPAERRMMKLVAPGLTVERLIELSRLGEFETYKALANLVSGGYLQVISPSPEAEEEERRQRASGGEHLATWLTRLVFSLGLSIFVAGLVFMIRNAGGEVAGPVMRGTIVDTSLRQAITESQLSRLHFAIEVFRLETGERPAALTELVASGILRADDLRYPWEGAYFYRLEDDGRSYLLLPPLF